MQYKLIWALNEEYDENSYEIFKEPSAILTAILKKYKDVVKFSDFSTDKPVSIEDNEYIFIDDFDIGFADDTCFYGLYIDFDTSLKATIENELSKLDLEACGEDYTFEYKIR